MEVFLPIQDLLVGLDGLMGIKRWVTDQHLIKNAALNNNYKSNINFQ